MTHTYLAELRDVAKLSGADFEKVLLEELTRILEYTRSQTAEPSMSKIDDEPQLTSGVTNSTHSHEHDSLPLVGAEAVPSFQKPSLYLASEQQLF